MLRTFAGQVRDEGFMRQPLTPYELVPPDQTKYCKYCSTEKPVSEFAKGASGKWGVRSFCKKCRPPTKSVKRTRPTKEQNRRALLRKHGLTLEQFDFLRESQGGRCAICGVTPKLLYVDHCHTTGRRRGLLCQSCNTAIGLFRDSTELLKRAVKFLEKEVDIRNIARILPPVRTAMRNEILGRKPRTAR